MPITFGSTAAPSQISKYFDALFTQSLANYRKGVVDNIGASNAILDAIIKGEAYESAEGGTHFEEPLMYKLSPFEPYDGYDELSTQVTDGVTAAIYEWRQGATPVGYHMKELIQNKNKLDDLVKTKMTQAEMGIQEGFAQYFMWGNYFNNPTPAGLKSPYQSPLNSALFVEPICKLIDYTPTSGFVGNIDQGVRTWWRNRTKTSAATTYSQYLYELMDMYNTCALGSGGQPTHIILDQVSYQNFLHAYFKVFKSAPDALDGAYPFVGKKFLNAKIIMDDKVPDVHTGAIGDLQGGSVNPASLLYGSAFFVNIKFMKVRYQPDRDFEMLKDENGNTFAKPINGDSRVGHCAWMGNVTMNNRRKQGVLGKIARTLTDA
jgi:hypothetical protein